MDYKFLLGVMLALLLKTRDVCGYKILGLFPYNGQSHIVMFKSIMKGLTERGHEVHVLSHYPQQTPIANYTDLSVLGSIELPNNQMPFDHFETIGKLDIFNILGTLVLYSKIEEHAAVMESEAVQKLLKSNERYDLIITESFVPDMMLGFVHKFKAPLVLLSSCGLPPWTSDFLANPQNPAFVPHFLSQFSPRMSFFERVRNTAGLITNLVAWHAFFVPANERIMRRHFGDDVPPILDILKSTSLILGNSHSTIHGGRPFASTVVDVGGVHVEPAKRLPRDIEKFIEDSPDGVIYFCMGSLLRAATFPEHKKNAFLYTFSKLKERVLWKFEDENVSAPSNVMIKEWMPQRDILAHPKVKLFIGHGGLLGTLEAMTEGKPMVGIPMFGDQPMNVKSLEAKKVSKYVDYYSITNDTIYEAVREMLKPKYLENARELSKLFHDRPMSPMDTAAYWVEYVIRNKGARNLRSAAVDMPFYQYLLLDVILFYTVSVIFSLYLISCLLNCVCRSSKSKDGRTKLKQK
nr:PREDICTED: UDP-glucuronosyltransferase 2B1-like [Bemisia tabaci]XP_018906827.1 PREDICTED: UDP-glucuronosyltransferase 2B1-like [Bemisia tabaci]